MRSAPTLLVRSHLDHFAICGKQKGGGRFYGHNDNNRHGEQKRIYCVFFPGSIWDNLNEVLFSSPETVGF